VTTVERRAGGVHAQPELLGGDQKVREWLFDDSTGEPQECKAAILEGSENAGSGRKAYEPAFIKAFGPGAGVLISQLFFWTGKGSRPTDRVRGRVIVDGPM
jgi:hypothetical protein